MNNTERGKAIYSDYSKQIEKTGKSFEFATIKAKLFNVAVNVGFTLALTAISKIISELHVSTEEYIESQEKAIQVSNENIEKYDKEILSLQNLQSQLVDAKDNKERLIKVTNDLNKVIGKTPGLINNEADAYDLANKKLEARIEYYKKLREQELNNIIESNKNIFENNGVTNDSIGSIFDFFKTDFRNYDKFKDGTFNSFLYSDYAESIKNIEKKIGKDFNTIVNDYIKSNPDVSNTEAAYELYKRYLTIFENDPKIKNTSFVPSQSEFDNLLSNQLSTLENYYSNYLSSYEGNIDKSLINSFMEDMIIGGYDLSSINEKLKDILNNSEFESLYEQYQLSLFDDSLNTESLYGSLKEYFDNLKQELPTASNEIDTFFNSIIDGIKGTSEEFENEKSKIFEPLTLDQAKVKVEGSEETTGLIDELTILKEVIADAGNVSNDLIEKYEKLNVCSSKYSSALKVEAGRIVVDAQKLKLLNKTRVNEIKTEIKEASTLKKLDWIKEAKRVQQLRKQQVGLTDNIWDTCDSLQEEINKFDMLVQGIDSASNAFTNFQNAQNASESGDYFDIGLEMANEIQKGLETGKVGVPEFIEAIKGAMPENLFAEIFTMDDADAQFDKIKDWYENVYSQFFIEGENADYDISGLTNFAKKVEELGYGTFKDGALKLFDNTDVEKLAQDLQLSAEQVYAIFGELEEYSIGDSFDFDSKNYIDDYYNDLNKLTEAQRLYNEAVESGNEYQIQIAHKMLADARTEYNDNISSLADMLLEKEQEWQTSNSDKSFGDYLSESYDTQELVLMLDNAKERTSWLKQEMMQLAKAGKSSSEEYKNLSEELTKLELGIDALENTEEKTTLVEKATSELVDTFKKYEELVKIIQNEDMGEEELAKAKSEAAELVAQLGYIPESVRIQIETNIDEIDAKIATLNSDISNLQQSKAQASTPQVQFAYQHAINQKQSQVNELTQQKVELEGILNFDTTQATAELNRIKSEDVNKDGTVTYSADFSGVSSATPPTLSGTVNYTAKFSGLGGLFGGGSSNAPTQPVKVDGTMNAFASGTAKNVSIKKNEEAVVNELGEEGLIRNGKLIPIKGGVQLLKLRKNDIILNHKQMEALKRNGHAVGRGKLVKSAYVNGSLDGLRAFGDGNTVSGSSNFSKGTKITNGSTRGSLDDFKDGVEDVIDETTEDIEEASKEVFDWIERRLSKLQRLTDKWIKNAETALTSSFITKYFNKAAKTLNQELKVQEQAFHRYQAEADKSGLSEDWKKKVNDGLVDIETITDETLAENINEYMQWRDKSIACLEAFATAAEKRFNIPLEKAKAKIENFNETLDLLGKKLDNSRLRTQDQLKSTNKLVNLQTKEERRILNTYKKAQKDSKSNLRKQSKAMQSSVVLKSDDVSKSDKKKIKQAVKNGEEINLSLFKEGSKAYQQAVKYNEALKANKQATYDAAVAQEEYNAWLVEASKIKFDNTAKYYENQIKMLEYQMIDVDNKLSEIEKAGSKVNRSYYDLQKQINNNTLSQYQKERDALEKRLQSIKKGTEEWYDAYDAIKQIDNEISKCTTTTYELNEAIRQLYFDAHEGVRKDIDTIIDEQEFLTSLFSHEKTASSEFGNLTEAGTARLGSAVAKMNLSEERAKEDEKLLKKLQGIYSKYQSGDKNALLGSELPFDSIEQLEDAIENLYQTWQDDIKTTYDMQAEVADIMKEKYQAELDMYQELVESKKEALQAEKDLHDYSRQIEEKTSNIENLQMRLSAYSGDTSQEGMAKRQQLSAQLSDAQDDLKETEYDKYLADQQDMLDNLITEYQELIQKKMDAFYELVDDGMQLSNENLGNIKGYLEQVAGVNGYTQEQKNLFDVPAQNIVNAIREKNAVTETSVEDAKNTSQKPVDTSTNANSGNNDNTQQKEVTSYESSVQQVAINRTQVDKTKTQLANINAQLKKNGLSKKEKEKLTLQKVQLQSQLDSQKQILYQSQIKLVEDYIKVKGSTAQKAKSEYSDVNKKFYSIFGKKILSTTELKELASLLGVSYNNAKKSGNLYKELKNIGLFASGGIAKVIKSKGEDGFVLARNGEGFVPPENVPAIQALANIAPQLNDVLQPLAKLPNLPKSSMKQDLNNIVCIDNVTLPNVTNYDEFKTQMMRDMQKDKKFESMVQDMTINRLSGNNRLGKYRQNM